MPAKSAAQFRMMQAAAHGKARGVSISPAKAKEFVSGQSPKGLPEHVGGKKKGGRMRRAAGVAKGKINNLKTARGG